MIMICWGSFVFLYGVVFCTITSDFNSSRDDLVLD